MRASSAVIMRARRAIIVIQLACHLLMGSSLADKPGESQSEWRVEIRTNESERIDWEGAGMIAGLQIWWINLQESNMLQELPVEVNGIFFNKDCYVILNTYEVGLDLKYDVHYWIGRNSSQKVSRSARQKARELDDHLEGKAELYEERQDNESEKFKGYFKEIQILDGSVKKTFEEMKPVFLRISGTGINVSVEKIQLLMSNLNSQDVFILDFGTVLYQRNGSGSNEDERNKAAEYVANLNRERMGVQVIQVKEGHDLVFRTYLAVEGDSGKSVIRLSDASGQLQFENVTENVSSVTDLDTKDVYFVDSGKRLYVWLGNAASANETAQSWELFSKQYSEMAERYPVPTVTVIISGSETNRFIADLAA